jgi:hypothetical protein
MRVYILGGIVAFFAFGFAYFWSDLVALYYNHSERPVSVVDNQCQRLWVPRAQNDPALICYLQTRPERLCDPAERESLVWTFNQYVSDRATYLSDLKGALVAISVQTGLNNSQSNRQGNDPLAALNKATATVAKDMKSKGIGAAMNVVTIPRSKMAKYFRALAEKGYIQQDDFGWWPDSLITRGFEGISNVKSPCATRQK